MKYEDLITHEILKLNEQLLREQRAWRASELKSEANGLAKALQIYYAYGFNTSSGMKKDE